MDWFLANGYESNLTAEEQLVVLDEKYFNTFFSEIFINKLDPDGMLTMCRCFFKPELDENKKSAHLYVPADAAYIKTPCLFNDTNLPETEVNFFRLGRAYHIKGNIKKALSFYNKCIAKQGIVDKDEVFLSLFYTGMLQEKFDESISYFIKAWDFCPSRAESLYQAAILARRQEKWKLASIFAALGKHIPMTHGILINPHCYKWGMKDELAIAHYWLGEYQKSRNEIYDILPLIPQSELERVEENLKCCEDKLNINADRPKVYGPVSTQSAKIIAKLAIDSKKILVVSDYSFPYQLVGQYASPKAKITGVTTSFVEVPKNIDLMLYSLFLESSLKADFVYADQSSVLFDKLFWHLWQSVGTGKLLLTNDLFRVYNANLPLVLDAISKIQPNFENSDFTLITKKSNFSKVRSNHNLEPWELGISAPPDPLPWL